MAEIVAQVQELSPLSASLTLKLVSRHSPNFVPRPLWLSVADGIRQTGSAAVGRPHGGGSLGKGSAAAPRGGAAGGRPAPFKAPRWR